MPERYADAIMKYLAERSSSPLKSRQLARQMGIGDENYHTFREAVKQLRDEGRIVLGSGSALMLPEMGGEITGFYRRNPKGFGFVIPEHPNAHGDLFIPPDGSGGAMTGDLVRATTKRKGKRDGRMMYEGKIVEILQRGRNQFVGLLRKTGDIHFILPEGKKFTQPILLRDVGEAGPKLGTKVVVEIVDYGRGGDDLPAGVIVEVLGEEGELAVETRAVIHAHGLKEHFDEATLRNAREVTAAFDPDNLDHKREDVTAVRIATIDPADARDYDDAISLQRNPDGTVTLGVHIADVAHFVTPGSPLDEEAKRRSTSTYFPRRVLPMLPEILSNGVCSLQEGQKRLTKSAFITYDADGKVVKTRLSETIIRSMKRLTYEQAQSICDAARGGGKKETGGFDPEVVELVKDMETLARKIEARRRKAGMIHLDLPAIDLVLDDDGKVIDAVPEDTSYSHTIIEMFMVEANEAVARKLRAAGRGFLRRIHPDPDDESGKDLGAFVKACGQKLPKSMTPKDIQALLASVKGKPESYAVNLAVLKTFQQAQYSPMEVGHFALASDCYCHFTSPIRRYPDLTVHRLMAEYCRKQLNDKPKEDIPELMELGRNCTAAERRSEAAESELRQVLILQFLATKEGEIFDGVITGVANFGIFVQWPKYLCEGLIRLEDLGDDWWQVDAKTGAVRGEATGRTFRMGDGIRVRVLGVDVARRQLNLLPVKETASSRKRETESGGKSKSKGKKGGKKRK
ncbi:MAG: ribonuclease R [Phycisphaerae bacterium]|nr:ribonuclease R [Phycisphaerae bacterium]